MDEVKFIAIQQFPLNRVTWIESNSRGQGHGDIYIQFGSRAFGANGLKFLTIPAVSVPDTLEGGRTCFYKEEG